MISLGYNSGYLTLVGGQQSGAPELRRIENYTRNLYKKSFLKQTNLTIIEGTIEDLIIDKNKVCGAVTDKSEEIYCGSLVLTTGTFLRGLIRIGKNSYPAGRLGDKPSINLAKRIESLKFSIGRLKTGTPPRIYKKSINFKGLQEQTPDKKPVPFSFVNKFIHIPQVSCFITHTNHKTHKIIKNNIHLSPMYSGQNNVYGRKILPIH